MLCFIFYIYVPPPSVMKSDYPSTVPGSASVMDAGVPGYYGQYVSMGGAQGQPLGDNILWTTAEPVTYLSGYDMSGNYISGSTVFRGVDYPQHLSYGWFPGVDYGEWGTGVMVGGGSRAAYPENYYFVDGVGLENYSAINNELTTEMDVKSLQQSLEGMTLEDGHPQFSYTMSNMPSTGLSSLGQNGASWTLAANQYSHHHQAKNVVIPRAPQNSLDIGTWNAQPIMRQGNLHSHKAAAPLRVSAAAACVSLAKSELDGAVLATGAECSQTISNSLQGIGSMNAGQYNPNDFELNLEDARFFIIKSYSEDDVHRSIKYGIWCSTEYGNKRLDAAYQERNGHGAVYLLFSVNGSGHFCGVAEMTSPVDYLATSSIWAQSKWKGQFEVRWIYVKDVPNSQLRHVKLENNENKPVTNSRDTQEVPPEKGKLVMRIIHQYRHTTSIFDDFSHYEQRQEDERKVGNLLRNHVM